MSKGVTRTRYDKLVAPDTFIGQYLAHTEQQETPYAYDFWAACWLLSLAVGRNTVVSRPSAPVFLNLYTIIVGESGVTRKSTAVRHATSFAHALCERDDKANPQLIANKTTPEMLEHMLHEQSKLVGSCSAAVSISELVTFLGREKYTQHMPTLLTDLYDCPATRGGGGTLGSVASGGRAMYNVFVSFLSASTPAWLLRAVNPDVIEGGFTSRVLFIVETKPKRLQPWPEKQDDGTGPKLIKQLRAIRAHAKTVSGLALSPGARKVFDNWYRKRSISRDAFRSSFQSREDAHVLRLAAFLSINDGTWHIQQQHLLSAIKVITQIREDGASIFATTGAHSRVVLGIDRMRDKLLASGINGCPQTALTKLIQGYMPAEQMRVVLDIIHDLGMVQRFENVQVGKGRPITIWRATAALAQSRAIDKIMELQPVE